MRATSGGRRSPSSAAAGCAAAATRCAGVARRRCPRPWRRDRSAGGPALVQRRAHASSCTRTLQFIHSWLPRTRALPQHRPRDPQQSHMLHLSLFLDPPARLVAGCGRAARMVASPACRALAVRRGRGCDRVTIGTRTVHRRVEMMCPSHSVPSCGACGAAAARLRFVLLFFVEGN